MRTQRRRRSWRSESRAAAHGPELGAAAPGARGSGGAPSPAPSLGSLPPGTSILVRRRGAGSFPRAEVAPNGDSGVQAPHPGRGAPAGRAQLRARRMARRAGGRAGGTGDRRPGPGAEAERGGWTRGGRRREEAALGGSQTAGPAALPPRERLPSATPRSAAETRRGAPQRRRKRGAAGAGPLGALGLEPSGRGPAELGDERTNSAPRRVAPPPPPPPRATPLPPDTRDTPRAQAHARRSGRRGRCSAE